MATTNNTAVDPTSDVETFDIPEPRFAELEKRVERLNRRAAKLGQAAVRVVVHGDKAVSVEDAHGFPTGRVRIYKVVEIVGKAPVVAGYTFVAACQHTEAGNIISKAPGERETVVPAHMRDGLPTCDHCGTRRHRKDTFILRDNAGALIRVGRNCLADFLRGESAAEALRLWSVIHEIRRIASMDEEEGFRGGRALLDLLFYVACVFRAIAVGGWVSRSQARIEGVESTSSVATFAASPAPQHAETRRAWQNLQPTDADKQDASEAVEWAKGLVGASDYEHNLKVACSLSYVEGKNTGLVASVAAAYRRHQEREVARKLAAKRTANSEHFGDVGSRYVRRLIVTKSYDREGDYGLTVVYTLEDEQGNVFKWWASGGCYIDEGKGDPRKLQAGDSFYFTFTVKRHGTWKDTKETTITRGAPSKDAPTHKWVGKDGEVFKTKKALLAASA